MSIIASIRGQIVPVHREGLPFIGIFALASLLLFWLWSPLGWIGTILTVWCALFFRDPVRVTPVREGLVVSPAAGRARARRPAAAAHLGVHERVQLPCEPQPDRGQGGPHRLPARPVHQRRA